MKNRGLFVALTLGSGLTLALLLAGALSSPAVAAPRGQDLEAPDAPTAAPVDRPRAEFGPVSESAEARMGVYYGSDEAAGMYDVGHTFWITVTDGGGAPKAHASATTTPNGTDPYFALSDGFCVENGDWSDPVLDIQPGDWVHFHADDGFTNSVHVGTITGLVNLHTNTVAGTITAPWFVQPLQGMAGIWGVFWQTFPVDPNGGSYFVDFSPNDLLPGMEITVLYSEPDKDQVGNVFRALRQVYLPLTLRNH